MKPRTAGRETASIVNNPHFWLVVFLTCAITGFYIFAYYTRTPPISDLPFFIRRLVYFEIVNKIHGSLFFIPFVYAAIAFWWRGAVIVWLLAMAVILPWILYVSMNPASFVRNTLFTFIPSMLVVLILFQIKWRENQRKIAAEREAQRRVYLSQVFSAQEDERQRIARELHDDTTQSLLVIANRAQSLLADDRCQALGCEQSREARDETEWIRDQILKVSEGVRRLSLDLRPSILDNMGLVPAIRWLTANLNQENGTDVQISVKGGNRGLMPENDVVIFRIIQEALSNVRRHAHASKVVVTLGFAPTTLKITVRDNGAGFHMPRRIGHFTTEGKLGLIGMQQRAEFLGGTLDIRSQPGKGTMVSAEVRV